MSTKFYVSIYISANVIANLLLVVFGPAAAIWNAFVFVSLDLTSRDALHDRWSGWQLWRNMFLMIGAGALISGLFSVTALGVAVASAVAFLLAGLVDTLTYHLLGHRRYLIRVNGSNILAALTDSVAFMTLVNLLAFPWPGWLVVFGLVSGQAAAKIAGGVAWSLIFRARRTA